jgi:hypothetical protein
MNSLGGAVTIIGIGFLIILAILWFCLPFAVFGTKPLIEESIREQKALRKAIEDLHKTIKEK